MIFLRILLDFVTIWLTLKNEIEVHENFLTTLEVNSTYGKTGGYVSGTWFVTNRGNGTYEEALELCKAFREEVFQVEKGMNLPDLFSAMGSNEVWTSIHKNKASKVVDKDGFAPISLVSDSVVIDLTKIPDAVVNVDNHVALKWDPTDSKFSYEPHSNTEKKSIVCKSNLSFPQREGDLKGLGTLANEMLGLVKIQKEKLEYERIRFEKLQEALPKLEEGSKVFLPKGESGSNVIDLNPKMTELTGKLNAITLEMKNESKTLKTELDLFVYQTKFERWNLLIENIKQRVTDPLFYPSSYFPGSTLGTKIFDSSNYKASIVRIGDAEVRIQFAKDFSQSVTSSLNSSDWQTVFTREYWNNHVTKLTERHFFTPSLYDIINSIFGSVMLIWTCVNFFMSKTKMHKIRKTQRTQNQNLRVFQMREQLRESCQSCERRNRTSSPDPQPLLDQTQVIRETRPMVIPPMYSQPNATIVDVADYPTTLQKKKRNRKNRKPRPKPVPGMPRPTRTTTQEPLYLADSFLSLDDLNF
jgi:hypothetical protein